MYVTIGSRELGTPAHYFILISIAKGFRKLKISEINKNDHSLTAMNQLIAWKLELILSLHFVSQLHW